MTLPLEALYAAHGATLEVVAGQPTVRDYGDFPGEVAALEEGVGVVVREACGVLLVQGADAVAFLNGLTTNNVSVLAVGGAHHTLLCATKGKILYDLVVVRFREDGLLLLTEPGEAEGVASHLEHYHVREELQLGRVELTRIDLIGPAAEKALEGLGIPPGTMTGSFNGAAVPAPRLPLGHTPRILALPTHAVAPPLVEAVLQSDPAARMVGLRALEEARIRAGVPKVGVDFGREHLPAEASLYDHLSFDKGCYVGQEIHARMHYRGHPNRKLVALSLPEREAAGAGPGSEIFHQGHPVGNITSLSHLAREGELRAIAMVRYQELQETSGFSLQSGAAAPVAPHTALASDLGAARK